MPLDHYFVHGAVGKRPTLGTPVRTKSWRSADFLPPHGFPRNATVFLLFINPSLATPPPL